MSTEEIEVFKFLKRYPNQFVAVCEISKHVGPRKNFHEDRNWALPVLRRMELEGHLEANAFGDYRLKHHTDETTTFLKALGTPGVPLGDTAIITLADVQDDQSKAA